MDRGRHVDLVAGVLQQRAGRERVELPADFDRFADPPTWPTSSTTAMATSSGSLPPASLTFCMVSIARWPKPASINASWSSLTPDTDLGLHGVPGLF